MMINADTIPFDVTDLVKSKAWHSATPAQRRKLISAGVTLTAVIDYYSDKYHAKKTLKGELIACTLEDFYWDLFEEPIERGLDDELERWYTYDDTKAPIDEFSDRILDEAMHPQRWIKIIKMNYKNDKEKLKKYLTDEKTGKLDLDGVSDISVEYRDCLY